jgi:hypothetical protein
MERGMRRRYPTSNFRFIITTNTLCLFTTLKSGSAGEPNSAHIFDCVLYIY